MRSENTYFDVCVLCALAKEARAFRDIVAQQCNVSFTQGFSKDNIEYLSTTILNNQGEPLRILLSWLPRFGPLETALQLQPLLHEFSPRFAAMTGICAGDMRKVKLGDLVIAERAFMADSGKMVIGRDGKQVQEYDTYTTGAARDILRFARMFDLRKELTDTLKSPVPEHLSPQYHIVPMASGNAVREDNPFDVIKIPVRATVAVDMEGAAFYQTVENFPGIRSLLVKGVSDYADGDKNDIYQIYASELSALYMLSFIKEYLRSDLMPGFHPGGSSAQASEGKSVAVPLTVPTQAVVENITIPESGPLKVFISYAPKDQAALEELDSHLAMLKRKKKITCQYSSDNIVGGTRTDIESKYLSESHIVLLLISPNYVASDVYESEVTQACALYNIGLIRVIPVLLSPTTDWDEEFFGKLHPLPKNKNPISRWPSRDDAFYNVAQGIKEVVEQLVGKHL